MRPGGDRLASGVPDLDDLLEGLILGDNVVWVTDGVDVVRLLEDALLVEALGRRQPCFYVTAGSDLAGLRARLDPAVQLLDAGPRGPYTDAGVLETAVIEGS